MPGRVQSQLIPDMKTRGNVLIVTASAHMRMIHDMSMGGGRPLKLSLSNLQTRKIKMAGFVF